MTEMRTCYLHIGTHKTGTTSIQKALSGNREALKRHGILFPQSGLLAPDGGRHELVQALITGPADISDCASLNTLLEEIAAATEDVLISSEALQLAVHHQEKFRTFIDALRRYTPRIVFIVYFRDQADYARSLYVELIGGCRENFDRFLSAVLRDGHYTLEDPGTFSFCYDRFLDKLPSENVAEIIARHYDSATRSGLVADFLGIFGLTLGDLGLTEEPRENVVATTTEVFLRFYRDRRGTDSCPDWLVTALYGVLHKYRFDLSPAARYQIVATFDRSNRAINARFPGFALPTLDAGAPAVLRDDCLSIDHVLSDVTVQLVAALETARDHVANERDAFARLHAEVASYRDLIETEYAKTSASLAAEYERTVRDYITVERQRDAVASERDQISIERDLVAAERDRIAAELEQSLRGMAAERERSLRSYADLERERDRFAASHDEVASAHASLEKDRDRVAGERDRVMNAYNETKRERDRLLASRSWRVTAPLRALAAWAKRLVPTALLRRE